MRAFTLDSFESPPGLRDDLPTPAVGAGEVLVRVHASSVNGVDVAIAAGMLKGMAEYEFPVTLGRDYAGVVAEVGSAVGRYRAGDEVFGFVLHANPAVHDGSWAEYATVPEDVSVARKPDGVDFATAGRSAAGGAHCARGFRRPRPVRRRHRAGRRRQRRRRQLLRPAGRDSGSNGHCPGAARRPRVPERAGRRRDRRPQHRRGRTRPSSTTPRASTRFWTLSRSLPMPPRSGKEGGLPQRSAPPARDQVGPT